MTVRRSVLHLMRRNFSSCSRFFSFKRGMASDHIERTVDNTRHELISPATVVGIKNESETIKSLTLKVKDDQLTFKAGQWVDMFIPGVETVGGFSMYSSPTKLRTEGLMDLAVKFSDHPPANWIHTQCKEGDEVKVRVGGDFSFDPEADRDADLLLIAGGVGINPLYSIINEIVDINKDCNSTVTDSNKGSGSETDDSDKGSNSDKKFNGAVSLHYSARTRDDLIFKEALSDLHGNNENIMCQFYLTREGDQFTKIGNVFTVGERIQGFMFESVFDWLKKDRTIVYICGPCSMIEDTANALLEIGISADKINYEQWW